jgi:hypothetical protein
VTALTDLICFFGMLTAQNGDCAIYHGHGLLSAFSRNDRELGGVFNETFH